MAIDKELLIDDVIYHKKIKSGPDGPMYEQFEISNVRIDSMDKWAKIGNDYVSVADTLMFIDTKNTNSYDTIKDIKPDDKITYNGRDMYVISVEILRDRTSVHHLEVWCK